MKVSLELKSVSALTLPYLRPPKRGMWTLPSKSACLVVILRLLRIIQRVRCRQYANTQHGSSLKFLTLSIVGFLAQTIRLIEDHPFPSQLIRHNPTLIYLRQAALLSKNMPDDLREAILGSQSSRKLLEYLDNDRERRAMVRTSTAIDVVQGGDKGKWSWSGRSG